MSICRDCEHFECENSNLGYCKLDAFAINDINTFYHSSKTQCPDSDLFKDMFEDDEPCTSWEDYYGVRPGIDFPATM